MGGPWVELDLHAKRRMVSTRSTPISVISSLDYEYNSSVEVQPLNCALTRTVYL